MLDFCKGGSKSYLVTCMTQEIYKFRADARATRVLKDPCFNHLLSELREVWEVLGTREAIQWVGSLSDFRTETVFQPVWKYVSILTISVHISDWILSWCFTWEVCPGFQIPKYYSELESATVLILRDFFYAFSAYLFPLNCRILVCFFFFFFFFFLWLTLVGHASQLRS